MFLLDDLLLAPAKGTAWLAGRVKDLAEEELYDPTRIQEELAALAEQLRAGEISDQEAARREADLLERLEHAGGGEPDEPEPEEFQP